MASAKPWQIGVVVVGLVGGIALIARSVMFAPDKVDFADSITVVDVSDGQLFVIPVLNNRAYTFPMKNPSSGENSLLPVVKSDGQWRIVSQAMGGLDKAVGGNAKQVVDAKTGAVNVLPGEPKPLSMTK